MESGSSSTLMMRRAEIDTRAPFRSVKEAVSLFGERVLAGEVYAYKLNQMKAAAVMKEQGLSHLKSLELELDETKQSLAQAREERIEMAKSLISVKDELDQTKKELKQLKAKELTEKQMEEYSWEVDDEDIKFVKDEATEINPMIEFQKKRCVTFAHTPSFTKIMNTEGQVQLQRQFSLDGEIASPKKKKNKKSLIPLISVIFSKKKGNKEDASSPKYHRY